MKRSFRTVFSVAFALILAFSSAHLGHNAVRADNAAAWTVPSGYNENDYNRIAAFLETEDKSGVKNGAKLSSNYDPSRPSTWGVCFDPDYYNDLPTVEWTDVDGEFRVRRILMYDKQLTGSFDMTGLSSLFYANISANEIDGVTLTGCSSLWTFDCYDNLIADIDVSTNSMLRFFRCDNNMLLDLDVSANSELIQLNCEDNLILELDLSSNTMLELLNCADNLLDEIDVSMLENLRSLDVSKNLLNGLDISANKDLQALKMSETGLDSIDLTANEDISQLSCVGNPVTALDLYANPVLMLNELNAGAGGTVGCELDGWYIKVYAVPDKGYAFDGWYNAEGGLISVMTEYEASDMDGTVFNARFIKENAPIPGDVDGDGVVTIADVMLTLRYSLGLIDESALDTTAADMDGNGSVTVSDAISILRITLGL